MKPLPISLTCDCGAQASVAYGERWTCPNCGRTFDTSQIPGADYDRLQQLNRRYWLANWAVVACMAALVLVVALTGQLISIFAGLAVALLSWFLYIKPLVHRRHRRAVSGLTRSWKLEAR
jgi:Flp pilus assembly protein TadB